MIGGSCFPLLFSGYSTNRGGMADVSHAGFCSEFSVFVHPSDVGPNVVCCKSLWLDDGLFLLWHTHCGSPFAFLKVSSITDVTTGRNEEESNNISAEINLFPPYCRKITPNTLYLSNLLFIHIHLLLRTSDLLEEILVHMLTFCCQEQSVIYNLKL